MREPRLGVGAVAGVRVEEEERGQEGTQGEPQTAARFVFPQRLKRRERETRRRRATKTTKQQEKERERERDTSHTANTGRVLQGKTKTYKNLCFRAKTQAEPKNQEEWKRKPQNKITGLRSKG